MTPGRREPDAGEAPSLTLNLEFRHTASSGLQPGQWDGSNGLATGAPSSFQHATGSDGCLTGGTSRASGVVGTAGTGPGRGQDAPTTASRARRRGSDQSLRHGPGLPPGAAEPRARHHAWRDRGASRAAIDPVRGSCSNSCRTGAAIRRARAITTTAGSSIHSEEWSNAHLRGPSLEPTQSARSQRSVARPDGPGADADRPGSNPGQRSRSAAANAGRKRRRKWIRAACRNPSQPRQTSGTAGGARQLQESRAFG